MDSPLATPIRRSLFALPLLAVAIAAMVQTPPSPVQAFAALVSAPQDCRGAVRPTGALALARMPGDLGRGFRLRCAA